MKTIKITALVLCASLVLSSCATFLSGTTDKVNFKSNPPGAKVFIDDKREVKEIGITNSDITIKRRYNDSRRVTYKKEGYKDLTFTYEVKIAGAYFLGFFGAGIPMIIDIATGAALKARYDSYEKTLEPKK